MLLTLIVVGLALILLSSLAVITCMLSARVTSIEETERSLTRLGSAAPMARTAKAVHPGLSR